MRRGRVTAAVRAGWACILLLVPEKVIGDFAPALVHFTDDGLFQTGPRQGLNHPTASG